MATFYIRPGATHIPLELAHAYAEGIDFDPESPELQALGFRRSSGAEHKLVLLEEGEDGNPEKGTEDFVPLTPELARQIPSVVESMQVMATALRRGGWERAQTHQSLLPYLREETEEFIAAVELGDHAEILSELGDLYLQVLFHAQLLSNAGQGDLGAVAKSFVSKMRVRAPYFFDGSEGVVDELTQEAAWQEGKRARP